MNTIQQNLIVWFDRSIASQRLTAKIMYTAYGSTAPSAEVAPSSALTDEEVADIKRAALDALGEAREDAYSKRDGKEADRIQREIEAVKRMTTDQLREWVRSDGGVG